MNTELPEEHRMLKELVARFVREHLIPLEPAVLSREAAGQPLELLVEEKERLDKLTRELGLWGLDAPEEMGGSDLPVVAMVGVNEALGHTVTPYELPPDSPNLRMLMLTANEAQRARYLAPYARGETVSAIAISEPGAGGDPAMMSTRAERDGDHWILNGRKIWISRAARADWTIAMAVTDKAKGARGGISAFIVDRDTPGFRVERRIPMIGGVSTYEVAFDDCRVPSSQMLGREGHGFAPMQSRLSTRRVQMAAWCIGRAQRALDMLCEYAQQRETFGARLADRQAIQWWVANAATRIHACRLMTYDAAARIDAGDEARMQVSMIKVFATEMAWDVIDHAMQTLGAMGMTKELPLQQMANETRLMRIYEGPSEVHRWVIARELLGLRR
ncbi:acyl-CoA dehydrogenase [Ottowia sp. GY511]|uniref:Acyl-CoA dehydrogenase family protein n=1 Tax=Ottowia flava TaxID=2675430 RepID=A0ABW4KUR6_9BURK|nr:acyl-CoA dehydrogenase family protein [Ottowia sp. GY511]TXK24776.1 acyl-CoA dehydrogenase [Ottowia sp. GY511]